MAAPAIRAQLKTLTGDFNRHPESVLTYETNAMVRGDLASMTPVVFITYGYNHHSLTLVPISQEHEHEEDALEDLDGCKVDFSHRGIASARPLPGLGMEVALIRERPAPSNAAKAHAKLAARELIARLAADTEPLPINQRTAQVFVTAVGLGLF